jgi:ATP-dependent DNA helicase RecQ
LIEQGIIKKVIYGRSKKYEYQFNAPELNTKAFDELREQKLNELSAMSEYVNLKSSRMKFLCDYLGDNSHTHYQNCDNTTLEPYIINPQEQTKLKLQEFRASYFPELIVASTHSNIINGVASSYYGVSSVGTALHRSKYENGGDFPDFLLKLTLKAFRKKYGQEQFDFIVYVPPTESGDLVKNFAEKLSQVLKAPISHKLIKTGATQPQKTFKNGYLKKDNVAQKFSYSEPSEIVGKSVILFDDIFDSGATIKEIGNVLTKFGVTKIAPLVIARTVGGDI